MGGRQVRTGAPAGDPGGDDDGDDDDRGSRRDQRENPEDLLNRFRKSMNKIGQGDKSQWSRDRGRNHRGGDGGGDPGGDDGGDDGHDRSVASSRHSQAGDDGYGARRWQTPKPETGRVEIFKQRKSLPQLVVTGNWRQA
eukprot:1301835-Amphidinium_carterae.1